MAAEKIMLNAKLRFSGSNNTIERTRLYPLMDKIRQMRLTTVVAGAGYGKTTLVHQTAKHFGLPVVWYRLDPYDDELVTFLYYLIAALRNRFPALGNKTLDEIARIDDLNAAYKPVMAVLLSEMEEYIRGDLLIVLDDYHTIADADAIRNPLAFFIDNIPSHIHVVIISRTMPNLELSLYRARREMMDITETDLCFSADEIEQFYLEIFNLPLKKTTLQTLHRKTAGWVSSLILFYHALSGRTPAEIEALLVELKGSSRLVSTYLEENVYNLLSDDIKQFLVKTSIFSRINVKLCDQLLGINNSREILDDLERKHLFTFCLDGEGQAYCYHHLFQDFLQSRLQMELKKPEITALHRQSARLFEAMQNDEEALRHYLAGDQVDAACLLLSKLSTILWSYGTQSISTYLKKMAGTYTADDPWIFYLQAVCFDFSGRHSESTQLFEKAHSLFVAQGSQIGAELCMGALGHNYCYSGNIQKAETILNALIRQVQGNPELVVASLCSLIQISVQKAELNPVDEYFERALALSLEIPDQRRRASHRSFIYFIKGVSLIYSGKFKEAITIARYVKEEIEPYGLLAQFAQYCTLISTSSFYLGNFSKGYETAEKGLMMLKERRLEHHLDYACHDYAWLLFSFALNSFGTGKMTDIMNHFEDSLRLFRQSNHPTGQAIIYTTYFWMNILSGDIKAADDNLRLCKNAIEGRGLISEEGRLACCLALSAMEKGDLEAVPRHLKEAEKKLRYCEFETARISILYARYYTLINNTSAALEKTLKGLKLAAENQYDFWIKMEFHWIVPLLAEIYSQGRMKSYLEDIFKQAGEAARAELIRLNNTQNKNISRAVSALLPKLPSLPAPGLRIYCFGKFRIFKGETEISFDRWKSNKKALMLLKYLLINRHRGFKPKDVLMEILWPDQDNTKTVNRLHVALTALRKILEPELVKGMKSSYILNSDDSYMLTLGDDGFCDIDLFLKTLKLAERHKPHSENAITHYSNAESLYKGELFEEDPYMEWCSPERDDYRKKYQHLLKKIIAYYEGTNDLEKCIQYANIYLAHDKYAEEIYQALMSYYSSMGNMAMVALIFEKCKENIVDDLDCPLSKKTEKLYKDAILA
ncbi:MAG: hypothetical protein C0403_15990 [Desulfobacterium sp.]|nr:hypothetical protein [Desulfobacterium sp.]